MITRREFLHFSLAGAGIAGYSALLPKGAWAQTLGAGTLAGSSPNWAIATDLGLQDAVWRQRFKNTLPWALDPTNSVYAKALNGQVALANPLPAIGFIYNPDSAGGKTFTIKAGQVDWPMLAPLGNAVAYTDEAGNAHAGIPTTPTWGYGNTELENVFAAGGGLPVTFPGRSFVVQRSYPANGTTPAIDNSIYVNWQNNLVDAGGAPLDHLVGVDQTISMQTDQTTAGFDPVTQQETYDGNAIQGVPIAIHHHGGDTAKEFDGGPDQWFTPRRVQIGPGVIPGSNTPADPADPLAPRPQHLAYTYTNMQEACMNWYHDHGEGVTRINAYAGLAGLYVIRDRNEDLLIKQNKIPSGPYEVPLVIQDKCFTADGGMAYAGDPAQYPVLALDVNGQAIAPPTGPGPNGDGTDANGAPLQALPSPTHHPEQFGDVIVVNGMAWPNLDVEPREYRLRLLNGSDSRVYTLQFGYGGYNARRGGYANYLDIYKISNDLGLLNTPVPMPGKAVTIAPGERMDIVVDFGKVQPVVTGGPKSVVVTNNAGAPFPLGLAPVPGAMGAGTVMQFNVKLALNDATTALGQPAIARSSVTTLKNNLLLRGLDPYTPRLPRATVPAGAKVRRILLGEGLDEFGRIMPLMGALSLAKDDPLPNGYDNYGQGLNNPGTLSFSQRPSETPALGSTEVWEIWNSTVDAHPIHLHLVRFRILNRQVFTAPSVNATPMVNGWTGVQLAADAAGTPMDPNSVFFDPLTGLPTLPVACPAHEAGWKDTVICYPGQVTRIVMTFDRPGKYVYHCHILSHEEHDMMRWYEVK